MSRPSSPVLPPLACLLLGSSLVLPAVRAQDVAPSAAAVLEALPGDTLAVMLVDDVSKLREDYALNAVGRMWADAGMTSVRSEFEATIEGFTERVLEETTLDLPALLEMVSGPAAVALLHVGPSPSGASGRAPDVSLVLAVVLDVGEHVDEFSDSIDAFLEYASEQPNTVLESESVGELDVALLADESTEGNGARFGFVQSYFVFTLHVQDLERDDFAVIAEGLASGEGEGLASTPAFRATPAAASVADVRMFWDTASTLRAIFDISEAAAAGRAGGDLAFDGDSPFESDSSFDREKAESVGLFGLGPVSMTADIAADEARSKLDIAFSGGGRLQDLLLAGVSGQLPRLEGLVPAEATTCMSLDLDFAGLYDAGLKWLMDEDPEQAREMLASMDEAASAMGFHPREDLLGNMDGQFAYFDTAVDASEALPFSAPGAEPTSLALLIGLSDGAAMRSALDSVIRANGMHAARERHEFEGFEYYTLPVFPGVVLAYAVLDDLLVLTPAPSLITDVLRRKAAGGLPSIGNREDVVAALAGFPGTRTIVNYSDQAASMRAAQATLVTLPGLIEGATGAGGSDLDLMRGLLEALAAIDPAIFETYYGDRLTVMTFTLDDDGLHAASVGP